MQTERRQTRVDLLRHGEHELDGQFCGVTDPRLTEGGLDQLRRRCDELLDDGTRWDVCISSPRLRCLEFADAVARDIGIDCVVEDGFAEVNFGDWEGLTFQEIKDTFPGDWECWINHPDERAPHGGENLDGFRARVKSAWERVLDTWYARDILVISHAGVMRMIYSHVRGVGYNEAFDWNVSHAHHARVVGVDGALDSDRQYHFDIE